MIGYTIPQAAARLDVTASTIEQWITAGWLTAPRNPIDGHRYIREDHLLDVDQAVYTTGAAPTITNQPLPLTRLRQWLWDHGRPVSTRTLEQWVIDGRLIPHTPGRRGRGGAATYRPEDAIAAAMTSRMGPCATTTGTL